MCWFTVSRTCFALTGCLCVEPRRCTARAACKIMPATTAACGEQSGWCGDVGNGASRAGGGGCENRADAQSRARCAQLRTLFPDVTVAKPRSSRNSSVEAFAVCRGYAPPPGLGPGRLAALLAHAADAAAGAPPASRAERLLVPFLACGDLSGRARLPVGPSLKLAR